MKMFKVILITMLLSSGAAMSQDKDSVYSWGTWDAKSDEDRSEFMKNYVGKSDAWKAHEESVAENMGLIKVDLSD